MSASHRARIADDLVRRLAAALRGAQLYAPTHPLVMRSVGDQDAPESEGKNGFDLLGNSSGGEDPGTKHRSSLGEIGSNLLANSELLILFLVARLLERARTIDEEMREIV